jgi:hypothetical protein
MLLAKSEKNIWLMLSHRTIQQRSDEARSSFAEISKISECHGNPSGPTRLEGYVSSLACKSIKAEPL